LASELQAEIDQVLEHTPPRFRIHASHGFAIEALHESISRAGVESELRYCGSSEAVASLASGACEVAGFHVPQGEFEETCVQHYLQWLRPGTQRLIPVASRRVGLMVAAGDPMKIYGIKDLARQDLRFINRQSGSGTRFLLDLLLKKEGIDPARIRGYEQCELTHAAVAAFVASGMADVGLGVETPARQFKLEFVPLQTERYFLLCEARTLETPRMRSVLKILSSNAYKTAVNQLPGYRADQSTGKPVELKRVFADLPGRVRPAVRAPTRSLRSKA
jgi:molybdate-binding protein